MKKLIALVIVAVMLLSMMPMVTLAADTKTIYLNAWDWNNDANAWFAVYHWDGSGSAFERMTRIGDEVYEAEIPASHTNVVFLRMSNTATEPSFDGGKCWNQTVDLTVQTDGNNCFSITAWNDGNGKSIGDWNKNIVFPTGTTTVHVKALSGWTPHAYSWGTIDGLSIWGTGAWSGTAMSSDPYNANAGWYTIALPAYASGMIVNNAGSGQTVDISITAGTETWITVNSTESGGKKTVDTSATAPTGWYTSAPIKVTLDPGEGTVTSTTLTADPDGNVTLPAASRPNYVFDGWYKEAELTNLVGQAGETVTFTGNATIYAKWSEDMTGRHTITFMNGTNEYTTAITKKVDANIGKLETIPDGPTAPANYTFGGWYKDLNDENSKVTTNTEFTAPTNVYAKWVKKPTLTLSFNLNGGEGNAPANASSVDGVVTLPAAPTRNGYTFNGWYDAVTGGNLVIAANATTYTFNGDADATKTLYAQWTQNQAPAGPSLSVVGVLPGLSEWTPTDPNAVMTPKEGDIYEYLFENVAANTAMTLKITTSAGWNDAWNFGGDGNTALTIGTAYSLTCNGGSANLTFTIDTACDVKVTLNLSSFDETTKTGATLLVEKVVEGGNEGVGEGGSVTPPPATEDTYIVAGTANLCGTEWDPSNAANKLTKQSDGTYTITYNNVEADNYALKVTNGTWDKAWPTENYAFGVTEKCNVTVTFNPTTGEVKVTGDHVGDPISTGVYIVAGSAGLCGEAWNTTLVANKMTKQSDGTYTITYTDVAAGDYEFKVTDGTWNNAWPNQNYALSVAAKSTVTITFNADAETVTVSVVPVEGEGGEQGGSTGGEQGGTEGGNQSGTTGNPEVPTGSLIIHAKVPAAWASAYLYAWNTGDDVMASWPGTAMTKGDDGWYTIEIPAGYKNIIVAEKNGGEQTVDLSIANVTGNEIWVTLGEKNSDGKYPATIAEDEKGEEIVAPPEVKQITVYAKVPANWTTPYVYAWNGSGNNASWPGVAMTKGENGWWYAKVPATAENVIISNNGKTQTVDLKLEKLSVDAFVQVAAAGADGKYTATVQYSTNPDTGDTAIIAPVVFLMVMSVTGLAVLTVGKKKYF